MTSATTALLLSLALLLPTTGCAAATTPSGTVAPSQTLSPVGGGTQIVLGDSGVTVDGQAASDDASAAVYVGAAIVYYEAGNDTSYGEGTQADEHSADEAAAHTVVTITQPGTYQVSGTLRQGQLAVDLGEDAQSDPSAVVTLVLNGADITCTVAPAVIFYNVYECGQAAPETPSPLADTTAAGANVILADGSMNNITGSYVARIYKEGTDKKLHKYDGAFYSKMSMNVSGGEAGTGVLNITAENEGLDSELHLSIHGGIIQITAQNDGINTNEDGVSVTTIHGGTLTIDAGLGEEGDGIDSNGYLVINGGTVISAANGKAGDGGIDSDSGIYLNGGTVIALGSRNDAVEVSSAQAYMELSFASTLPAGSDLSLADAKGDVLFFHTTIKECASVTLTSPDLVVGETYSLYVDDVQQQYTATGTNMGGPGGMGGGQPPENMGEPPEGMTMPTGELPENGQAPGGGTEGTPPEGMGEPTEGEAPPEGTGEQPQPSEGGMGGGRPGGMGGGPGGMGGGATAAGEGTVEFTLTDENKSFSGISDAAETADTANTPESTDTADTTA